MSSQSPSEREDDGEDVLAALRQESRHTSNGHDETVLAAARGVAAERARRRGRAVWFPAAASFAALAVIAFGLFTLLPREQMPSDALRGAGAEVSPANGATLAAAPAELSWPPQAGAAGYRLVLRDAAARPLWTSPLQPAPRLELPEDARQALADAGAVIWTVEVENGRGRQLGPFSFRIEGD